MRHGHLTFAAVALAVMTGQTALAQSFQPCQVLVGFQPRHAVAFEGSAPSPSRCLTATGSSLRFTSGIGSCGGRKASGGHGVSTTYASNV